MFCEIDGLKINYEVKGEGNPVVMLHGWGVSAESFAFSGEHLSEKFKVYRIDFPGFGKSDMPKSPMSVYDYAEITLKLLNALEIKNPILIGHSFGGRIIICLTGKMGYTARKIILVDSAGIKPRHSLVYYIRQSCFKISKKALMIFLPKEKSEVAIANLRKRYGSADYNNATDVLRNSIVRVVNEDLTCYLKNITPPTLLIWGENDDATPLSDAHIMEKHIKDSGLVVLKGCSHFSFVEKPYDFNIIVDKFLENDTAV